MGRLFWKIFLAFWVAMLLIAGGVAAATWRLEAAVRDRAAERRAAVATLADEAAEALEAAGVEGLERWLREAIEREGDYLYVLDGRRELLGRRPPPMHPPDGALAGRPPRDGRPPPPERRGDRRPPGPQHQPGPQGEPPPRGDRARGPDSRRRDATVVHRISGAGERYHLVVDLGFESGDVFRSPGAAAMWIGPAVLISGLVCFLLARYLASPARDLRHVTRRFTAGELGARVGGAMGGRRDEIADLGRDFDAMAERIERMLTSQRRLMRDLSHELRSPLARLQVALELARKRAQGSAGDELDRIELEAERLNELIGEMLTLTRLEAGPAHVDRVAVDLSELVGAIVDDAAFEAESEEKSVRLEAEQAIHAEVHEGLLRRAVENVVRNAVRHTPPGTEVEVFLERSAGGVSIRVRDRGTGVAESSLPHLFEPFFRDPEARAAHPGGHGIGLAIARRAIEVHGGEILARNDPPAGLVVEIRI